MRDYIKITTTTLFYAMFVFSVILLVFSGFSLLALFSFGWFLVSSIVFKIMDKRNINSKYKLLVVIAVWLGLLGVASLYETFQYYDKVIHFIIGFFITLIVYAYFVKNLNHSPKKIMVLLSTLGILTFWEFAEFFADTFFGLHAQGVFSSAGQTLMSPNTDTMLDLITGALGSLMCLAFKRGEVI